MAEAGSVLSAHIDTNLVTREQLAALPAVIGTDSFKPVAHIELVQSLERKLNDRGIQIVREQFAMGRKGDLLFGTMDLTLNGIGGTCASLGLRTANDRTMALQMIAGLRVFVCDNMAFSGDTIMMKRRHTSGLNLMDELTIALDKYEQHYRSLKTEVENLKALGMSDADAKVMIHDVFASSIMPSRFMPVVSQEYFATEQRHEDFAPRTAWSLLNAFTEVAKQMPLTTRIKATQLVGKLFGKKVN
jgi:hypothetical protein